HGQARLLGADLAGDGIFARRHGTHYCALAYSGHAVQRKPLARNEFLDAHAVIDVPHVHGTIFANGKIMAPVDLTVIIAEAAPLGEDLAGEVELKDLTTVGGSRSEVASVDDVEQIVGADGQRPGSAQFV